MENSFYKRFVAGTLLISIGIILLFDNLKMLPFALPDYVFTWQAFLILLGIYLLLTFRFAGIVLITIGGIFIIPLIPQFATFNLYAFWPAALILIGLLILLRGFVKPEKKKKPFMNGKTETSNFIKSSVIAAGESKKFSAYEFNGAKLTAICGGQEIDLSDCYLTKGNENVLDLTVICGGITLKVSKEWNIKNEISPIMGGIEDTILDMPGAYVDPAAELILRGTVIMGGVEIIRV